jgi:hypothetical protein
MARPIPEERLLQFRDRVREHLSSADVEIVACVEGADPISGHKFQARQSWTLSDIEFDMAFVSPLTRDAEARRPAPNSAAALRRAAAQRHPPSTARAGRPDAPRLEPVP